MRKRKSSLHVTLVLIGAAGLAGCGRSDQPEMRRDVYASLADCRADWDREENCEAVPRTSGATGTTSGSHYYGPRYYSSGSSSGFSSPHRTSRSIGTHSVSRGGFGSSSSFHSSGSEPTMQRESVKPRPDWRERCEAVGFGYHTIDGTYWDESACYRFTADEIDVLEGATAELHRLCLEACDHVVSRKRLAEFAIPAAFHDLVSRSWRDREFSVLGRFDLAWTGTGAPRMLEYDADTPTALLESSVVQWHWMEEVKSGTDQFNSIHERLIDRWKVLRKAAPKDARVTFSCVRDSEEDMGNVEYQRDTAIQAGFATELVAIEDIGWDAANGVFVNAGNEPIDALFKLYPWEWLTREAFAPHLLEKPCQMIEPAWKMILSNKAILAVLWELFPDHPNLLPAYRDPARISGDYVRKPILSREGANVALRRSGGAMVSEGTYGAEGYVYQGYAPLFQSGGNHAVIGSWIVGDEAAGIGIREDDSPITKNTSRFVPHYFV